MASVAEPAPAKKSRNNRKPLKQKNETVAQTPSSPISAVKSKQQTTAKSFEKDLKEMQDMLGKLKIEKEKTEEMLKEKDEILRRKEEELEMKGMEQEKLKMELKKLQKMKEFKPNMTFPLGPSLKDAEQDKKGKKKKKDCPEKKRPSTSYMLWCKDQWNVVKNENPEAEFKEISNILGAKWKNLSAEERKPYEGRYQSEKDVYLQMIKKEKRESEAMKLLEEEQKQKTAMELLDQYLQFIQEAEKEKKKNKKEKDPSKPKHPISAFMLFSNERRTSLLAESKNVVEAAKIAGEEWKNMSEKQKAPFEEMAEKNKKKYLEEMEAYKQKKEEEAMTHRKEEEELMKLHKQEALQLLKKKEKTENMIKKKKEERQKKKKKDQDADPNKPKKPASSFLLFSKDARKNLQEERPGINNSTLNAMISVKWKELGEEERRVWSEKAAEAMEVYKKELEEYNKKSAAAAENKAL